MVSHSLPKTVIFLPRCDDYDYVSHGIQDFIASEVKWNNNLVVQKYKIKCIYVNMQVDAGSFCDMPIDLIQ